jgi:RND family efflux transporter MFP subunit
MLCIAALLAGAYWQRDAVLSLVGLSGPRAVADSKGRGGRDGGRPGTAAVRFAVAEKISIQRSVDLSGTLAALDQARVSTETAGIVKDLNFELGQTVEADQVLVQLDTRELELARTRAESALRQIEAQLGVRSAEPGGPALVPADEQIAAVRTAMANRDEAKAQYGRAEELLAKGLISRADRDTVQTRLKIAEAALQSAIENVAALKATLEERRAAHALAQKKIGDATIRAPMAGAVSERLVARGEFVRENTQIATIVQTHPLKLRTAVQERYANLIRPNLNLRFRVESFPNRMFEGKISNISPSIDQGSRTFNVEALVDNAQNVLKPGAFATGSIYTHFDSGVVAVPVEAVSILAGVSSVVVVEDGTVRQQSVTLGAHPGKVYEVLVGL